METQVACFISVHGRLDWSFERICKSYGIWSGISCILKMHNRFIVIVYHKSVVLCVRVYYNYTITDERDSQSALYRGNTLLFSNTWTLFTAIIYASWCTYSINSTLTFCLITFFFFYTLTVFRRLYNHACFYGTTFELIMTPGQRLNERGRRSTNYHRSRRNDYIELN